MAGQRKGGGQEVIGLPNSLCIQIVTSAFCYWKSFAVRPLVESRLQVLGKSLAPS